MSSLGETIYSELLKNTPLVKDVIWIIINYYDGDNELFIEGKLDKIIGQGGHRQLEFDNPEGIITDGIYIYICDTKNNRIQVIDKENKFVVCWVLRNSGRNFLKPRNFAIHDLHIYIIYPIDPKVQVFSIPDCKFIKNIPTEEICNQEICKEICIYNSHIYLSFYKWISVYTLNGTSIKTINREYIPQLAQCAFSNLFAIDEDIYIVNFDNIACLSIEGKYKFCIYGKDYGVEDFNGIRCISLTQELLYVSDNNGVQQFSRFNKKLIKKWHMDDDIQHKKIVTSMAFVNKKCYTTIDKCNSIHIFK